MAAQRQIAEALLAFSRELTGKYPRFSRELARRIDMSELFPARHPEASKLVAQDPYAFAMALCLDRQTLADIIWTVPYDLKQRLGHLDPFRIDKMSLEELGEIFPTLAHKPRFYNDAPRTVKDLTHLVVHRFGGDASRIWAGKTAAEVHRTFKGIFGVGQQIANLSVLLIEQRYGVRFSDLDHRRMDIKADTHTRRVLFRLGVAWDEDVDSATDAARMLNPDFPGELDPPLWIIGRVWCHASRPVCDDCPVSGVCMYGSRRVRGAS